MYIEKDAGLALEVAFNIFKVSNLVASQEDTRPSVKRDDSSKGRCTVRSTESITNLRTLAGTPQLFASSPATNAVICKAVSTAPQHYIRATRESNTNRQVTDPCSQCWGLQLSYLLRAPQKREFPQNIIP